MNSWHQLLLWNMAQGRYLHLGKRELNTGDWVGLWVLVQEMEQVRVSDDTDRHV
ncbi:MAG: hypothetical protein V3W37_08730 [Candidatus Binatia bacterium]